MGLLDNRHRKAMEVRVLCSGHTGNGGHGQRELFKADLCSFAVATMHVAQLSMTAEHDGSSYGLKKYKPYEQEKIYVRESELGSRGTRQSIATPTEPETGRLLHILLRINSKLLSSIAISIVSLVSSRDRYVTTHAPDIFHDRKQSNQSPWHLLVSFYVR